MRVYEAYEDNAGGLAIFALDDGRAVWSGNYYGREVDMAVDWGNIVLAHMDPIAEGWDDAGLDLDDWMGLLIADSEWDGLPYGIDIDQCGEAGQLFALHAGASSWCPGCGSIIHAIHDDDRLSGWDVVRTCPVCGEDTLVCC